MKNASEIMNKNVFFVHPENSLADTVKVFTSNKISGLPVVDSENRVVGVISDRDLLDYSEKLLSVPLFGSSGLLLQYNDLPENITSNSSEAFSKTKVSEVMSKKALTVREDAMWFEVINLMRKNSVNRLPVVDNDGKLKGIITRTDIINNLADGGV